MFTVCVGTVSSDPTAITDISSGYAIRSGRGSHLRATKVLPYPLGPASQHQISWDGNSERGSAHRKA